MDVILGYIANIGLDAIKEKIKDPVMEAAVRARLDDFLKRQQQLNFNCTREEEIDFERLSDYIRSDMIDDVKDRFFGDKSTRRSAYNNIMSKSIRYAQSKTTMSKERAKKMVSTSINILKKFYESKANRELSYYAARIEDTVIDEMTEQHYQITQKFDQLATKVDEISLLSIEHSMKLVGQGKVDEVGTNLSKFFKAINTGHPLYPHYGFDMKDQNGKMISIALTKESIDLYPPRFNIIANSVKVGTKDILEIPSYDVLGYSYRYQSPIILNVEIANKLLGNILDPVQDEATEMQGREITIYPPEFTPAFPCSISMDGEIIYDYLLMRTKQILEDGTIISNNEEQVNRAFTVTLTTNLSAKKMHFNIAPINASSDDQLKYRKFMKKASQGGFVEIKALALNTVLGGGKVEPFTPSEQIDAEIELLKKVTAIEKFFQLIIAIPQDITIEDHKTINYVYQIIHDGSYSGKWSNFSLKFEFGDDLKFNIEEMNDTAYSFAYSCIAKVELFDQIFDFPMRRTLNAAKIKDMDRLKQKIKVLECGDIFTVTLVPDEDNKDGIYEDVIVEDIEIS
ncbi:MAG: hypothetical protein R3Y24_12235 [Eubacteriales bacterium]